jgi:hypothetical protein
VAQDVVHLAGVVGIALLVAIGIGIGQRSCSRARSSRSCWSRSSRSARSRRESRSARRCPIPMPIATSRAMPTTPATTICQNGTVWSGARTTS